MQLADHGLEVRDRGHRPVARVARLWGEVAERVVAPVVGEPQVEEARLVDDGRDGEQRDRGDPQALQVLEDGRLHEPQEGAAELLGHVRVLHRQAPDVRLVQDGVLPRDVRPRHPLPVEGVVDHGAQRRVRRAVALVAQLAAGAGDRAHEARVPAVRPPDRLGVGIEQHLVGVEAVALVGRPRAVDAEAVATAAAEARHVPVPHRAGPLGEHQRAARLRVVGGVEQHHLDAGGVLGVDREVHAAGVRRGARAGTGARARRRATRRSAATAGGAAGVLRGPRSAARPDERSGRGVRRRRRGRPGRAG